jgi:uncharacterized iron-regulated membrane protein
MDYFKALLVACIALLTVSFAGAKTLIHPVGVEVTFPDEWFVESTEDELLLSEDDESAAVVVTVMDAGWGDSADWDPERGDVVHVIRSIEPR